MLVLQPYLPTLGQPTPLLKEADVSSFQTWEAEVIPHNASPLAYRAPGSAHVVVLLPGSALGCYLSLCLLLSVIIIYCKLITYLLLGVLLFQMHLLLVRLDMSFFLKKHKW